MNIELPNDWGAIKRLHHQPNHSGSSSSPLPSEVILDEEITKKRKEPPPAQNDQDLVKTQHSGVINEHRSKIVKGPLGPRGIFNAVTHDTPEKGQLKQIVMMHLGEKQTAPETEIENELQMEVHCLLSKLPYQKMLSDLFSHNDDKELLPSPNIPYVTKSYEESFMREPINSTERLCAKGDQCECMYIDSDKPFTAIEFLLPGEKQPPTPHLCVVCCRAVTQQLYYDIMFDKHDFGGVIQRFGNIHSQAGEYALDAMLIAAPNVALHIMPLPIVSHQRNRYSVFIKRGIKHLKQSRVYFQNTPSC
jgi:hypothetical protein